MNNFRGEKECKFASLDFWFILTLNNMDLTLLSPKLQLNNSKKGIRRGDEKIIADSNFQKIKNQLTDEN